MVQSRTWRWVTAALVALIASLTSAGAAEVRTLPQPVGELVRQAGFSPALATRSDSWLPVGWTRRSDRVVQIRQNGWLVDVVGMPSDLMPYKPGVTPPLGGERQQRAIAAVQKVLRRAALPRAQTGTKHALCLMISYSDMAGTVPASHYNDLLFSVGTYNVGAGSMHDFYNKASHGQLDFQGTVPNNWLTSAHTHDYWGNNAGGLGAYPQNAQGLVEEAVALADPQIDYSQYDDNGDGEVDHFMVVHAGPGRETTGDNTDIHSHSWGVVNGATNDGVRIGAYIIQPEDGQVGVFSHEMGHQLGLPDLYDYGYDSSGVGDYCLMASGSWGGGGDDPSIHSAWCRYALGWETPTNVTSPLTNTTLVPSDSGGALPSNLTYQLWRRGQTGSSEYFIIENRQQAMLPSKGLLVWHVDESVTTSNDEQWYPGLPNANHYLVALEQADGNWDLEHNRNGGDANDAYPILANSTFNATSTPNSHDYADTDTEVTLRNIARSGQDITIDMASSNAGPPASIEITQQPTNALAGAAIAPAIGVRLLDGTGRLVDWATQDVTVTLEANPGSATLSGTTTMATVTGATSFANLSLDKSAAAYTLKFSSAGCPDVVSNTFDILPGTASSCAIVVDPTDVAAGSLMAPAVEVQLYDASNNAATTDDTTVVTLALDPSSNSPGATLSGTTNVAVRAGRARFTDLIMDKVGTGYKLIAAIGGSTSAPSAAFSVTPGPAAALAMVASPTDGTAGVSLAPSAQVRITDQFGNPLSAATNSVSATLEVATGTPPALGGTVTRAAVGGVATFNDLKVNLVGSGYTLRFTSSGLTDAVSTAFAIGPNTAASLAFLQQPSDTQALAPIAPAVTIELLDAYGNRATGDSATTVDIAMATNPTSATLSGGLTQTASNGVVTFGNLSLNRVGTGYTLSATAASKPTVTSSAFAILQRTPDPSQSTVTLSPSTIGLDGQEATLHIVLRDSIGLAVQGNLPASRSLVTTPATGLVITDAGAPSDDDGMCEIKLAATAAGGYNVAPMFGGVTLTSLPLVVKQVFSQDFAAGLYCLGLPLYMADGRPLQVLGASGWRMARYDGEANSFVPFSDTDNDDPRFSFARARGHWVRFLGATTLRVLGEMTPNSPFDVTLAQGWNCLANPFDGSMPWDLNAVKVLVGNDFVPLSNPTTWDTVAPYAWYWDGTQNRLVFDPALPAFSSALGAIPRAGGLWVWCATANTTLRLPPPVAGASRAARSVNPRDWSVALTATGPDGATATVTTGVSASLARNLRLAEPPKPAGASGLSLVVLDGTTRLAGDLRSWSTGTQNWDLLVTSPSAGSMALTWPSLLRSLPSGLTAELTDQQTGRTVLLNTLSAYRFDATRAGEQRRLRLTVKAGHIARSTIASLGLVGGRAAGSTVAIALTGPADITLRVKGLGGKLVKEVTSSATEAGTVQVSWDGTDADGRPVPAGTYQLEATAVSPNGAISRAVRAITVR